MDIAASSDTAVRMPTIEVRPKADSGADRAAPNGDTTAQTEKPDFWHRTFGKDGFTFSTLLDIVNPLQHIPVVSTIYQKITGDVASPGANIIGGALFGGVVGLAVAGADTAIKSETGKDIGGHVFAMFDSKESDDSQTPVVADATDPAAPADSQAIAAAATDTGNSQKADKAAPVPVASTAIKTAATTPTAKPATQTKQVNLTTPFAFSMGAAKRHAASNGIGGSFVPLETRASIAPAAFTVAAEPTDSPTSNTSKLAQKADDATAPDLQTLASNPGMLLQLQKNGLRNQPNTANGVTAIAPNANKHPEAINVPLASKTDTSTVSDPAPVGNSAGDTSASNDNAGNDGDYAALMARNLARYMALQNKNTPAKVNQRY